jgi:phosphoglycolate phosphatase
MNNLILFDIDKTLIEGSAGHQMAFTGAFKNVYGIDTNISIINHHGMTDQQIIIEVLKKKGLDEQFIKSKLKECMDSMVEFYEKNSGQDKIILLETVNETLNKLKKKGDVLGLVTGNLEPIACSKLKKSGIDGYFSVGGFGSDDISRTNLVRLAVKRAENKFNIKRDNIFLVGDAPQDMQAGKEAEVKTVGVITGIYSKEELTRGGADYVVANLRGLLAVV